MKKSIAIMLAVAMILVLVPATALADGPIDVADATALNTAILGAADVRTIRLTANITGIQQMTIAKTITIEMNGFSISGNPTTGTAFRVEGGDLTLNNTSGIQSKLLVGTGQADDENYEGIRIAGSGKATVGANVTIETGLAVFIYGNGTAGSAQLDVYGRLEVTAVFEGGDGSAAGDAYATISGNGGTGKGGTIINIYPGAEIINTYTSPMYIPQMGVVNISGGTVIGKDSAIAIKSGTLNVSGGTLRATGPATIPTTGWSNGINGSGCAIQIESNDGYAGNIGVNITGGTIISANGYALYEYLDSGNTDTEVTSISISGGTFHSAVGVSKDILTSSELAASDDVSISGGIFSKGGSTDVSADVDPTYTIIIPATVDFGTLIKNTGTVSMPFNVTASGLLLEAGAHVDVTVGSDFTMSDGGGSLSYGLFKTASGGTALTNNAQFASFYAAGGTQYGRAEVNTADIDNAGDFEDTMVFTITYVDLS